MTKAEFNFYLDMSKALQDDLVSIDMKKIPSLIANYLNDLIIFLDDVDLHREWNFFFALDQEVDVAMMINHILKVEFPLFSKFIKCLEVGSTYKKYRGDWLNVIGHLTHD